MSTLRDVLPMEFMVEYHNTKAAKFLDVPVVEIVHTSSGQIIIGGPTYIGRSWPGKEKNVHMWWVLGNGYAVGWNENPARGWGFPIVKLKEFTK